MNFMFDVSQYKTAATKIKEVHDNYPMCRFNIRSIEVNHAQGYVWVVTEIYRDIADQFPAAVDVAYEFRSEKGVNRDFWVENCVTSSYGRCCSLLLGDDQRSSREDMEKVNRLAEKPVAKPFAEKLAEKVIMPVEDDAWTVKAVNPAPSAAEAVALVQDVLGAVKIDKDIPECKHGQRVWRTGNKNGKAWANMGCPLTPQRQETWADIDKCDPIWYVIDNNGAWKPQEARS
jgi:hypothetical protein